MEPGPSSRPSAAQDLVPAAGRSSGPAREADISRNMKTHFRVCRFIMEAGNQQLISSMNTQLAKSTQSADFFRSAFTWSRVPFHLLPLTQGSIFSKEALTSLSLAASSSSSRGIPRRSGQARTVSLQPALSHPRGHRPVEHAPNTSPGVKLGMRSVPVATACVLYHNFFKRVSLSVYEPYLVAMSCLYLAGKVEEQHIRTRDIINVSHRYFNSGSPPLECDKEFWDLRDSVVQCELLILRQLNFQVSFEHPHKYLLHYVMSVKSLVNRHAWSRCPVAETSWALLRDCYHGSMCIRHLPQHIAIATLYLALNSYGVELPVGEKRWWQVLCEGVTKVDIDAVISDLLQLYDMEAKCI